MLASFSNLITVMGTHVFLRNCMGFWQQFFFFHIVPCLKFYYSAAIYCCFVLYFVVHILLHKLYWCKNNISGANINLTEEYIPCLLWYFECGDVFLRKITIQDFLFFFYLTFPWKSDCLCSDLLKNTTF